MSPWVNDPRRDCDWARNREASVVKQVSLSRYAISKDRGRQHTFRKHDGGLISLWINDRIPQKEDQGEYSRVGKRTAG